MSNPVDLTNIHAITEGDSEMEKALFMEFLESSEKSLNDLKGSLEASDHAQWRQCAHALKGNSLNLGAIMLSNLCKKAQDAYLSPKEEKEALLMQMNEEYKKVREFLLNG